MTTNSEPINIIELLNGFSPDPECLLREISSRITNEMLQQIAAADYGMGIEKHLETLLLLRDTGIFPKEMYWFPGEVLELTRNSRPELPESRPRETVIDLHWMRAFCCAALLRATREPYNYGDGIATEKSLIHLIFSLRALPVDFTQEAVCFMAWLLQNSDPQGRDEQVCYYGIGLLWLALQLPKPTPDPALVFLAQWIVQREEEFRRTTRHGFDRWLLGVGGGNPPPSDWELLGVELCQLDLSQRKAELRDWVELIGTALSE